MSEMDESARLRALEAKIAAAKGQTEEPSQTEGHYSQANMAWRMVTELVAGLVIGLLIGLGLDTLLGTSPIMLVVFIGLGFAAGVRVMMRTAEEITRRAPEARNKDEDAPEGADGKRG